MLERYRLLSCVCLSVCPSQADIVSKRPDIINGYYNIDASLYFQFDEFGRRGHSKKLYKRRSRLDTIKYVFANRIVDQWNSLPDACVNYCQICLGSSDHNSSLSCLSLCYSCMFCFNLCAYFRLRKSMPKIIINDTVDFFVNCNQHFGNFEP